MIINALEPKIDEVDDSLVNIRNNLISGLKGRMILTLIEIAHNYPYEINHAVLCKKLGIPPSTLSNQIKKLIELDYLESSLSVITLRDARYRNYSITMKGISFLRLLREALDLSIKRFY
jgi:DNA-binding MarR family transcriptional regulator